MSNAISFSLYGRAEVYTQGARQNIKAAAKYFPEWDVVIHVEKDHSLIPELMTSGSVVIEHEKEGGDYGMMWRYATLAMNYERVIFRDLDTCLCEKDRIAVDQWIDSGENLHVINRRGGAPIPGGYFGLVSKALPFSKMINSWTPNGMFGDDERMLREIFWPMLKDSCLNHKLK